MNYGKAAYDRTDDILARLSSLESANSGESPYKTVRFGGGILLAENFTAERSCYFYAFEAGTADCVFSFVFPPSISGYAEFYANGIFITTKYFTTNQARTTLSVPVKKGVNAVRAVIVEQGGDANTPKEIDFSAEISGIIDKRLIEPYLRRISDEYAGIKADDTFTVFRIIGGEAEGIKTFYNAIEADVIPCGNGFAAVIKNGDGVCRLIYTDSSFNETRSVNLGSSYKKIALRNYSGARVFALKGNDLVEVGESDGVATETLVGPKGRDVKFFPAYNTEYIVADDLLGNSFVYRIRKNAATRIRRTFAIGKRKGLFIVYENDFTIWYSDNGKVYSQSVSDYCVYGEKTYICDGIQAIRVCNDVVAINSNGEINVI